MPTSVEKTYSEALFSLITEEKGEKSTAHTEMLSELTAVDEIFLKSPEFVKVLNAPTVSLNEKISLIDTAFSGSGSNTLQNFLKVLVEKRRIGYFHRIAKEYHNEYNKVFGITEITITTTAPLTEELRVKIKKRMSEITKKTVVLKEKIDKSLIGGIILDSGNTRFDGSIKTRLDALKSDISNIIA